MRATLMGWLGALLAAALISGGTARAEEQEVRIAQQFGISYLPLMLMEQQQLLEKQAKAAGLGDIKVTWSRFKGGAEMNDAILSGQLHFASGGVGPFVTIWSKTKGNLDVKGVLAMNAMPLMLNTRNPNVKSVKDLTEKDRIALPAPKVSIQAVTLQMAAEKAFGEGNHTKLDALTVGLSHPDAQAQLLSSHGEITAHFSSPPYQYQQLEKPGIHTVLNSYDVLGGPATFNVVWAGSKFHDANPKTVAAFVAAFDEALAIINRDKRAAAEFYLRVSKDKDTVDDILKMLNDPQIEFTTTPKNVMKYVDFMAKVGSIKVKPASWKDLFFPNVHALPGS